MSTQSKTKITNYRLFFDFSFYFIPYIIKYMYLCTRKSKISCTRRKESKFFSLVYIIFAPELDNKYRY